MRISFVLVLKAIGLTVLLVTVTNIFLCEWEFSESSSKPAELEPVDTRPTSDNQTTILSEYHLTLLHCFPLLTVLQTYLFCHSITTLTPGLWSPKTVQGNTATFSKFLRDGTTFLSIFFQVLCQTHSTGDRVSGRECLLMKGSSIFC